MINASVRVTIAVYIDDRQSGTARGVTACEIDVRLLVRPTVCPSV